MPIPQEWDLSGKTAIITADRRGWTPFFASALAEAGADVAVAGSDSSDMLEAVKSAEEQGSKALAVRTDVTDADDVEAVVNSVVSEFGRVDILVNNARVEFGKPFVEVTDDEWQTVMDFNVKSMFLCCRAVASECWNRGADAS